MIRNGECNGESAWWCVYVNGSLSKQVWQTYGKLFKKVRIVFCAMGASAFLVLG